MVFSLKYRRPALVTTGGEHQDYDEKHTESDSDCSTCLPNGVPEALSFDRIMAGGVCPPCTIRDFMNYLTYIEHDAENLQFFLWFKDYCQRFTALADSEKALSPEVTVAQHDATKTKANRQKVNPDVAAALKGTDFDTKPTEHTFSDKDSAHDSMSTPTPHQASSDYDSTLGDKTTSSANWLNARAEEAYSEAGLKWQPFTAQPFRQEVTRIIAIYLSHDGPRSLNVSERERTAVLHALQNTTHPTAFRPITNAVEQTLRRQCHPNFVRWTICNGNKPRVIFARGLGVATIFLGIVASILIVLSRAGRAWRVLPIILFLVGISTLIAAWKGMCVVLHGMHHRHLRPWELFSDDDSDSIETKNISQESLVSNSTNSYEDEPWVARYEKRNVIRKVFDREVWIKEPALRQIQDTIFIQAILGAFLGSCILTGIFCAVPHGNFY